MVGQKNDEGKPSLWRYSIVGLITGAVLLSILVVIGFPKDLWTPGRSDLLKAFLTVGLIFCGVLVLMGPALYVEDAKAHHPELALPSMSPRTSRFSVTAGPIVWVGLGFAVCAVFVIRYIYLIVTEIMTGRMI